MKVQTGWGPAAQKLIQDPAHGHAADTEHPGVYASPGPVLPSRDAFLTWRGGTWRRWRQ